MQIVVKIVASETKLEHGAYKYSIFQSREITAKGRLTIFIPDLFIAVKNSEKFKTFGQGNKAKRMETGQRKREGLMSVLWQGEQNSVKWPQLK